MNMLLIVLRNMTIDDFHDWLMENRPALFWPLNDIFHYFPERMNNSLELIRTDILTGKIK